MMLDHPTAHEPEVSTRMKWLLAAVVWIALGTLGFFPDASSAHFISSAYPATVTAEQSPGTITGTELGKQEFTTEAGTLKCNTAVAVGSLSETTLELTLTPTYLGCTFTGLLGVGATVIMNGCDYRLVVAKETAAGTMDLRTSIVCPEGKEITVTVFESACRVTIPAQTFEGVEAHNEAADIKATFDATAITYTIDEGAKCPSKAVSGIHADGTYKGLAILSGNNGTISITGTDPPDPPEYGHFTSVGYPATVSAQQSSGTITGTELMKHELVTKAGKLKCNTVTATGSLTATATGLTLAPTYAGCTLAGLGATVAMNGCDYRFTIEAETAPGTTDLQTELICPGGKEMTVSVSGSTCKLTIPAQTFKGVEAHNEAADIKATFDATAITYTIDEGAKCPNKPAGGTYTDGGYAGVATLKGDNGTIAATAGEEGP
jgi:hypothetical protein